MPFSFSPRSHRNLEGVLPRLASCAYYALEHAGVDFSVLEGVRSFAAEEAAIAAGKSRLRDPANGMHLIQADGYGHAVDLVPYIDGRNVWDWNACYKIAAAMRDASRIYDCRIRWGGCWDRMLDATQSDLEAAVLAYSTRYRAAHPGREPLLDGVHYEIPVRT